MLRRLLILTSLLSLVCQSFGAVVGAWVCEGKTCSTTVSSCCCVAAPPKRDDVCRVSVAGKKPCVGKCGCKLSVQKVSAAVPVPMAHGPEFPFPVDLPAVMPHDLQLPAAQILTYAPALANPPPPGRRDNPLLEGAPLRAPPAPIA